MTNLQGDLDPRMRNGWAEYQRLVLAELERHNQLIDMIQKSLQDIHLQLALAKEENNKLKELQAEVRVLQAKQVSSESDDKVSDALQKYRKWIIGGAIAFIMSVLIPMLNIFLKWKGIG